MKDKFPEIYKNKVEKLKSEVQKEYYYHSSNKENEENKLKSEEPQDINNEDLINKINSIFKRPNYVYKADVNIMYKNGKNIMKKVIGFKDSYLITSEGDKIHISEIKDVN